MLLYILFILLQNVNTDMLLEVKSTFYQFTFQPKRLILHFSQPLVEFLGLINSNINGNFDFANITSYVRCRGSFKRAFFLLLRLVRDDRRLGKEDEALRQ